MFREYNNGEDFLFLGRACRLLLVGDEDEAQQLPNGRFNAPLSSLRCGPMMWLVSSFVWMKYLESQPERYDLGIRLLSRGRIDGIYQRVAEIAAGPGLQVLDVGCGTGNLAIACAARGAHVTGIDSNAGMLEVARHKPVGGGAGSASWLEAGVAEIEDHFGESSLDAVVSCLVFSELSIDERSYGLRSIWSRLKPRGRLVIADEISPEQPFRRAWYRASRLPRAAFTYLLTQTTTQPVDGLAALAIAAGFQDLDEHRAWSDTFCILSCVRGGPTA